MSAQNQFDPREVTKAHQRSVILAELTKGPANTIYLRESLGIMSPAARVLELRRAGLHIVTKRVRVVDGAGMAHGAAEYVLQVAAA